jgi:lysophospholipid acyltransferase (LPLAT)-like uncharacterized protein
VASCPKDPFSSEEITMENLPLSAFNRIIGVPTAYGVIRFYLSLVRIRVDQEHLFFNHLQQGGKAIVAFWHQRFFGAIGYAKKFRALAPSAIISKSRDGELIARVAMRLGIRPVRGSSSREGKEALAAMVADLSIHPAAIHAVDGPQGPKGTVKAGVIRMAQLSQAAIFPLYISLEQAWVTRSWDRFLIPKPFSRILIRWDDPIFVPKTMDPESFEAARLRLENHLIRGHAADDLNWKWRKPL